MRNVAVYDDLHMSLPKTKQEGPDIEGITSFQAFTVTTMNTLLWANQSRFQMPWRWSRWSH